MKISGLSFTVLTFGLLIAAASFTNTGCKKELATVPVIDSLKTSSDTINAGGTALIRVSASDADGDALAYSYVVDGGKILGIGDSVYWQAPYTANRYKITVLVTDITGNQVSRDVYIVVMKSGKSGITGIASLPQSLNLDLSTSVARLYTSAENRSKGIACDSVNVFGFGPIVTFTFLQENPGTYFLDVWKDIDKSLTLSTGDHLGWYGSGSHTAPILLPIVLPADTTTQVQLQMNIVP